MMAQLMSVLSVSFFSQSMIGHCLGAAGGLEAIATVKAITTGCVHPTINQFVSSQ
jgi:3-oxoacyl-(acyl-carrier-protein) synthase